MTGLSPLARGTRHIEITACQQWRFIPLARETQSRYHRRGAHYRFIRWRGEHTQSKILIERGIGLSRWRGEHINLPQN